MAADVEVTRNSELMVFQAVGVTEAGIGFVDGYIAPDLIAVDAGRVLLPEQELESFQAAAKDGGLAVDVEEQVYGGPS